MDSGYRKRIDEIASDRESGAFVLCSRILALFEEVFSNAGEGEVPELLEYSVKVVTRRHSQMPSILRLMDRIKGLAQQYHIGQNSEEFSAKYSSLKESFEAIPDRVTFHALQCLREYDKFVTISNSGMVLRAFQYLKKLNKKKFRVFVTESNPGRESLILAKQLIKSGVDVVIIPDTAVMNLLTEDCCVVSGCDVISPSHFRNKVGSYQLAVLSKFRGSKYYLLGDSFKYVGDIKSVPETEEEYKPEGGIKFLRRLFEDVPNELIEGVITENGLFAPAEIADIAAM